MLLCLAMTTSMVAWGATWEPVKKQKYKEPKSYVYRFTLTDKHGSSGTIDSPLRYLSRKAVERRQRQSLPIDSTDLPVSGVYLKQLRSLGATIIGTSRWNNTVLVRTTDRALAERLQALRCVAKCQCVWESPDSVMPSEGRMAVHDEFQPWDSVRTSYYGADEAQIAALGGIALHHEGYTAKGITIAVLDGGFMNVDRIPAFADVDIKGTLDFVKTNPQNPYTETDHGTKVLSAMAVCQPHVYVGTAPSAAYWLLRCEDQQTEQPVEEDYWAMAAEFADSVGVDVINSSLGYNLFDNRADNHRYADMDGLSTLISRTASMLARKGIVLVSSVGNTGMSPWKKLTFPADAIDILSVGALTPELTNASFSSVGPTQDGRVKPDVMAIGSPASVISGRGTLVQDMGTSFAAPTVCGLVACLWQALPHKTATEIIDIVRQSGSNRLTPDNIYGYGTPNFFSE